MADSLMPDGNNEETAESILFPGAWFHRDAKKLFIIPSEKRTYQKIAIIRQIFKILKRVFLVY